jgi:hypothetical protein
LPLPLGQRSEPPYRWGDFPRWRIFPGFGFFFTLADSFPTPATLLRVPGRVLPTGHRAERWRTPAPSPCADCGGRGSSCGGSTGRAGDADALEPTSRGRHRWPSPDISRRCTKGGPQDAPLALSASRRHSRARMTKSGAGREASSFAARLPCGSGRRAAGMLVGGMASGHQAEHRELGHGIPRRCELPARCLMERGAPENARRGEVRARLCRVRLSRQTRRESSGYRHSR